MQLFATTGFNRVVLPDPFAPITAMDEPKPYTRLPISLPVNCPYCGQRTVLVPSDGSTGFYECQKDGLLMLPVDGRLRRVEPGPST